MEFATTALAVSLLLIASGCLAGDLTSAGYSIKDARLGNGGTTSASASFRLQGALRHDDGAVGRSTLYALRAEGVEAAVFHGDLNGDGVVDVADALRALRIAVGLVTPTPLDWARADVAPLVGGKPNADGKIDVSDALVILERTVGIVTW